jgi:hypothetical protein
MGCKIEESEKKNRGNQAELAVLVVFLSRAPAKPFYNLVVLMLGD